ncbi:Imm74 family immunity protein [Massilia sp. H6]|uniref:Imm74 family immunity protein n=1 Tax=Massilia sp. H6 TaxID=2970464 RepID=UPI0021689BB2|nr:Imm74 family immunity protein [Massilia sp. H6]UVW30669.1 Imm74 family immunity protein [Massilia sp. H6]
MILNVDRGHIYVQLGEKTATIPGEMFLPDDGKMGFVVALNQVDYWDPKSAKQPISSAELAAIVEDIKAEFAKGGHTAEFEWD